MSKTPTVAAQAGQTIEGTRKAFECMLAERGVYKKLGVSDSTTSNWRRYLKEGNSISIDKMEEMLARYGAQVISEKVWLLPTGKK